MTPEWLTWCTHGGLGTTSDDGGMYRMQYYYWDK